MAHNFGKTSMDGAIVGAPPTQPTQQQTVLNHPPSARWWYQHHPARWYVTDGCLLPLLGKLVGEPGVNGVTKNADIGPAQLAASRRGWTLIPWSVVDGGYVRAFQGRRGTVHLSIFETPKIVGNRTIIKHDHAGYRQFLKDLLNSGVIPPIDPDILDGLIEDKRNSYQSAVSENRSEAAAVLLDEIAVMESVKNPPKKRVKK